MRLLTVGDLVYVTGESRSRLENWRASGALRPIRPGDGPGNHRGYSLSQAVALATINRLRPHVGRPSADLAGAILRVIGSMTEEQLLAEFRCGRESFVPSSPTLVRIFEGPHALNVSRCYDDVVERIEEREAARPDGSGRRVGLTLTT